ncbi:DNA-binding protein [Arthrobacter sp.]|uniref:DNA-binding protein n=1 Tax=Arthrobacter sp. TaxID=1667 RepID=UPI003A91AF32
MAQDTTSGPAGQGTPVQRAADAAAQMEAAGEKVTVSAVRTRAGVSMEAARQGVEQWRNDSRPPQVPVPDAVQRAFATAWAAATADAASRYEADRAAAAELVEAAQAEAVEAGKLVDTEAARADAEAERATTAQERVGELERQLAEQVAKYEKYQQAMNEALEAQRTEVRDAREALAEARGRLSVLEEQAEKYWDNKNGQPEKKTRK